jgi:hypothetical protein
VLHTPLAHHLDRFGGKELAEQALVSPATASQVLTELERFDWLAACGQGPSKERHLKEPAALLRADRSCCRRRHRQLHARVVSDGANLAIIEAKSPGELLFRERIGGARLARFRPTLICCRARAEPGKWPW